MLMVLPALLLLARPVAPPAPPPPSRLETLGRIAALEDARDTGGGELARDLGSPDRGIRRRAALAAGRIADPSLSPALVERLADAEPEVRQMAAFALGLMGAKDAITPLLAALADPEPVVRARAAEALGRVGDARVAALLAQHVLALLPKNATVLAVRGDDPGSAADPWLEMRLTLFALAKIKDPAAAATALLNGDKPRFDWWAAAFVASRVETPLLAPALRAAAASNDPVSRLLAARGLGTLKDGSAVEPLLRLARDRDDRVVAAALRALATTADPRATGAAAAALQSKSAGVQFEALSALATLPPDPTLRGRLVTLVGSESGWLRGAALRALAHADREQFALVLSGTDPDPDPAVRGALAAALGESGDDVSLGILYAMLKDPDARVLPAVLDALRKARGNDAAETLKRYLGHADPIVRATALDGLAELKTPGLTDAVTAAYRQSASDPDLDARVSAVAALAVQKDAPALQALREIAAGDPLRLVRTRAAEALTALGETPPAVGPQATSRPPFDYVEAMWPYEPRPDVPLFTPRAFLHTKKGVIEIHLNVVEAPLTVASFIDLARRGYYDGLTFHRVVPGFVIQGGDPRGDGSGGPGYTLRCEVGERPYGRGTVGMALSGKDTGGSQFFITTAPTPHLDGGYTVFGWVASGLEVVDAIAVGDVIDHVEIWTGR